MRRCGAGSRESGRRLRRRDLSVGLLLGPSCAGDKEHFGIGPNGLLILFRGADAGDGGAERRELDSDFFYGTRLRGLHGKGRVRAGIEEQEPGPRLAGEDGFDALAIEPAGRFDRCRCPPIAVMWVSIKPPRRCATPAATRAKRELQAQGRWWRRAARQRLRRRRRRLHSAAGRRLRRRQRAACSVDGRAFGKLVASAAMMPMASGAERRAASSWPAVTLPARLL